MKGREVVLGVLMSKQRSGYEIKEVFTQIFSHFFDGSYGMIYPTLKSLEKEGLIVKTVIIQEEKPNKNMYEITEEGKAVFLEYLASNVEKDSVKSDFLMRMYFGKYLDNQSISTIIEERIKVKQGFLSQLKGDYEEWKDNLNITQQISFDIGISQYESEIKVLEKYLQILK